MAVSIFSQPLERNPAYNPSMFVIESDSEQPNFRFYIELLDSGGDPITSPLRLPKEPNADTARIDVSKFVRSFVSNQLLESTNIALTGGVFEYTFSLGEEYTYSWGYDDYEYYTSSDQYNGYTRLASTDAYIFIVGDQINVIQEDGGALKPMLTGLFTVVALDGANGIIINIPFADVGSGAAIGGVVSYSDGRKIIDDGLVEVTRTVYNGVFQLNDFKRQNSGITEFITDPRKFATNLKSGFRVMPDFVFYLNTLLFDITPTYLEVSNDTGLTCVTDIDKTSDAMQFKVTYDESEYDSETGTGTLVESETKKIFIEFGDAEGTLSEIIELDVFHNCTPDLIELLYCDRFGSYLPFYFRQVNDKQTEVAKESIVNPDFESEVIGATTQRSWNLRSDYLNDVELELYEILISSPDVRMKINGYWEKVIITTTNTTTARNRVKKRKEMSIRLAAKDEVNV